MDDEAELRAKVKESEAWHEHRATDWATYRRAIASHWRRFVYLVVLMAMMNMISHGTQDMYPTFLQHQRHYTPQDTALVTIMAMLGAIAGGVPWSARRWAVSSSCRCGCLRPTRRSSSSAPF